MKFSQRAFNLSILIFGVAFCLSFAGCQLQDNDQGSAQNPPDTVSAGADSLSGNLNSPFVPHKSSTGQTIYVPVYSHIYQQNHRKTFNLTATLSIRNADISRSFMLTNVFYYDSQGKLVKNFLDNRITIKPLASTFFVIEEDDLRGGVGANFIVKWEAQNPVYPPVVEAVMISTSKQQGISFVSAGRVLEDKNTQSTSRE